MNNEKYISELLFEYDCVIIPGFGGFIGNYMPARIQTSYHTFFPPFKSLLFNPNLKQNDGLLAVRISQGEKISYTDALISIGSLVSGWYKQLNSGLAVEIDQVGKLYKDKEGNFQFEQNKEINFLSESYGLSSVISPAVIRQGVRRKLEKKILRYTGSPSHNRRYVPKALKWAALIALPLGTAALFGISNFDKIKSLSVAYSGMLFSSPSPEIVKQSPSVKPIIKPKQEIVTVSPALNEPVKQEAAVLKTIREKPFAIIVGAFKFLENAEGLVTNLRSKGYDAEIAGKTKTGLYRVSLFSFTDKNEAFEQLTLVRSKEFSSAWLLVK
jgi:hypothetical protein